jgi:hypothetical protein
MAVERPVILDDLVAGLTHGCPDIRTEHGSIIPRLMQPAWGVPSSRFNGRLVRRAEHLETRPHPSAQTQVDRAGVTWAKCR